MSARPLTIGTGVLGLVLALPAFAAPLTLNHQGRVLDATGVPVVGAHDLTVGLYDKDTGGDAVWTDTTNILFDNGYFSVVLGDGEPLDESVFAGDKLFVQVAVDGQDLGGRQEVTSVPWSIYARNAGTATNVSGGTVDASEFLLDGVPVLDDSGFHAEHEHAWSDLTEVPEGVDDGDDDTLAVLDCDVDEVAVFDGTAWACAPYEPAHVHEWADLTDVPAHLQDGDDDTLADLNGDCNDGQFPAWDADSEAWTCGDVAIPGSTEILAVVEGGPVTLAHGSMVGPDENGGDPEPISTLTTDDVADWLEDGTATIDAASLNAASVTVDGSAVALATDLASYALATDLDPYALDSDLDAYALDSDLDAYALDSDLDAYALDTDLDAYALDTDLDAYALDTDLEAYAPVTKLADYLPLSGGTMTGQLTALGLGANTIDTGSLATGDASVTGTLTMGGLWQDGGTSADLTGNGLIVSGAEGLPATSAVRVGALWGVPGIYVEPEWDLGSNNAIGWRINNVRVGYVDGSGNLSLTGGVSAASVDASSVTVDGNAVALASDLDAYALDTDLDAYALDTDLDDYLPLTGGTLSGNLTVPGLTASSLTMGGVWQDGGTSADLTVNGLIVSGAEGLAATSAVRVGALWGVPGIYVEPDWDLGGSNSIGWRIDNVRVGQVDGSGNLTLAGGVTAGGGLTALGAISGTNITASGSISASGNIIGAAISGTSVDAGSGAIKTTGAITGGTINGTTLQQGGTGVSSLFVDVGGDTMSGGLTINGGLTENAGTTLNAGASLGSGQTLNANDGYLLNVKELELKDWDDDAGGADDSVRLLRRDGTHAFYSGGVVVGQYNNGSTPSTPTGDIRATGTINSNALYANNVPTGGTMAGLLTVRSKGLNATFGGNVIRYNGTSLTIGRSYGLMVIQRSNGAVVHSQTYDVYGDATQATALATKLASYDSNYIVAIGTYDEPRDNRTSGGLPAEIKRCGGSDAFTSTEFKYRSSYLLIGICGLGAGTGIERYAGLTDNMGGGPGDAAAAVQETVHIIDGEIDHDGLETRILATPQRWKTSCSSNTTLSDQVPPGVPITAKAVIANLYTFNSTRDDHVNHSFGRDASKSGWDNNPYDDATGYFNDVLITHNGDLAGADYYGMGHGSQIIPLKANGTFDARVCAGWTNGTHYITMLVTGYLE